jgi:hypothetical protein
MGQKITVKEYAPPRTSKKFVEFWHIYLPQLVERENFHEGQLKILEVFINNLLEYDLLTDFIQKNGYTYESSTSQGIIMKKYEEVSIRDKIMGFIRDYSKMLDIKPSKSLPPKKVEEDEWSL